LSKLPLNSWGNPVDLTNSSSIWVKSQVSKPRSPKKSLLASQAMPNDHSFVTAPFIIIIFITLNLASSLSWRKSETAGWVRINGW
jgi:hypothetical protein